MTMWPVMRLFHNRTAFPSGSWTPAGILASTPSCQMIRDNFDGHDRTNGQPASTDIGVDYPFLQLPERDV